MPPKRVCRAPGVGICCGSPNRLVSNIAFGAILGTILEDFRNNFHGFRCLFCKTIPKSCQDQPGICQEPAGQRLHLHTVLTYTRPVIPSRSQTARTQKGGAAVTGLWPPSMNLCESIHYDKKLSKVLRSSIPQNG